MQFPNTFTERILRRNTRYLLARERKSLALIIGVWCLVSAVIGVVSGYLVAAALALFGAWFASALVLRSSAFSFDEVGYARRLHHAEGSVSYAAMKDVRVIQWEMEKRHNAYTVEIELTAGGVIDCIGLTEESARGLRNELLHRIDHAHMEALERSRKTV